MTDTQFVTDNSSDPKGVTVHIVEDGKWTDKAFQPYELGYGVEPLNPAQAERIARRMALCLHRFKHNLGFNGW